MIALHCGAGYHSQALEAAYKRDLGAACRAGAAALAGGGDALAAVTAAIKVLEDSEHGNAGHGSNLSYNGLVECDASVMAGDGAFGAIAAAPGIENPVEAAAVLAREGRLPLSHGRVRPMMLAGDRAREWALSRGLSAAASAAEAAGWHRTDRAQRQWRKYRRMVDEGSGRSGNAASEAPSLAAATAAAKPDGEAALPEQRQPQQDGKQQQHPHHLEQQAGGKRRRVDSAAERESSPPGGEASEEAGASCFYDTVGCVVLAPDGSVAAGVSSGGILLKTEGRAAPAPAPKPAPTPAPKPAPVAQSQAKMTKIAVIYYSTYGHVRALAQKVVEGVNSVEGCEATLFQVLETLPADVLAKMGAPAKADDPVITAEQLKDFDGFLFGIPTRFGMMASQVKAFLDSTGSLWQAGSLVGKPAGVFVSIGTQGGGMETTALTAVTQFAHHGMVFVPTGYSFGPALYDTNEVRGGSAYGAGTLAGATGSRQPSKLELDYAQHQGKYFAGVAKKLAA
ncbi:putative NAD(P)H dehydrogenase (quinone) FQR1-like 1 [Chlorella sorokiniana]|uniref:NAD(P)H dehydrogenase (quinone) n=1 Tax=Chlorella sorokiniana TaxID=3076 RepID=A0A2P6TPD1_CHLSO|nr:putative NAD(P)H dehydrogenase (quinone) FQR1-like 1 [Chlorella sorokiniana]|eukprot:PRW51183.1 putative NAD(P)H dehydrogenase (quinone) FQR1-like 1 [Chlorella sorokiniana]